MKWEPEAVVFILVGVLLLVSAIAFLGGTCSRIYTEREFCRRHFPDVPEDECVILKERYQIHGN